MRYAIPAHQWRRLMTVRRRIGEPRYRVLRLSMENAHNFRRIRAARKELLALRAALKSLENS